MKRFLYAFATIILLLGSPNMYMKGVHLFGVVGTYILMLKSDDR